LEYLHFQCYLHNLQLADNNRLQVAKVALLQVDPLKVDPHRAAAIQVDPHQAAAIQVDLPQVDLVEIWITNLLLIIL
jgi:hypothetical protein